VSDGDTKKLLSVFNISLLLYTHVPVPLANPHQSIAGVNTKSRTWNKKKHSVKICAQDYIQQLLLLLDENTIL